MQVLDYSAGFPGAANIKRAGYGGAVRYIGTPGNIKCATAAELRDFTANGLGMALVFEQYATDWRGGWQAGFDNYRRARAHATAIGFPATRPIYMAVDQDVVSAGEFQQALDYLRGARDAAGGDPGLVGVYGEHDVCHAAASWRGMNGERLCDWFWQCRAWSGTPVRLFAGRHLYQQVGTVTVGGVGCDINDVLRDDWGQHLAEDDMSWTEQLTLIHDDGTTETHEAREWFVHIARRIADIERQVTPNADGTWPKGSTSGNLANDVASTYQAVGANVGTFLPVLLGKITAPDVEIDAEDISRLADELRRTLPADIAAELGRKLSTPTT